MGSVNCLRCGAVMQKVRLASGVEIDVCDEHGVWLDVGELQSIVAHAERDAKLVEKKEGPSVLEGLGKQLVSSAVHGAGFGVGSSVASSLVRRLFG